MSLHQSVSSISTEDQTDQQDLLVLSYVTPFYISVVSIFAVFFNGLMITIYMRDPARKKKMLLINLAVAECVMPIISYWMPITSAPYGYWLYGPSGCKYYAFTVGLSGIVVISTLTAMAVERYVVCHNFVHLHWSFTVKCRVIVITWLYGLLMTVPPLIGWGRYDVDLYKASCTWDYYSRDWNAKSFTIFLLCGGFVLPTIIILYCYGKIFVKIVANEREMHSKGLRPLLKAKGSETSIGVIQTKRRHSVDLAELNDIQTVKPSLNRKRSNSVCYQDRISIPISNSCENPISRAVSRNEKQLAKLIMLVILGFFGCWTPYALLTILCQLRVESAFNPYVVAVTMLLSKTSCAINPIIYALKEQTFRKALRRLFSG